MVSRATSHFRMNNFLAQCLQLSICGELQPGNERDGVKEVEDHRGPLDFKDHLLRISSCIFILLFF